jgi:hypothetical protein
MSELLLKEKAMWVSAPKSPLPFIPSHELGRSDFFPLTLNPGKTMDRPVWEGLNLANN